MILMGHTIFSRIGHILIFLLQSNIYTHIHTLTMVETLYCTYSLKLNISLNIYLIEKPLVCTTGKLRPLYKLPPPKNLDKLEYNMKLFLKQLARKTDLLLALTDSPVNRVASLLECVSPKVFWL